MHYTHPLDRFMMKHRRKFYFMGAICIWPSFFFFVWGVRALIDVVGIGWVYLIVICHLFTVLGLVSLIDDPQSEPTSRQRDQ